MLCVLCEKSYSDSRERRQGAKYAPCALANQISGKVELRTEAHRPLRRRYRLECPTPLPFGIPRRHLDEASTDLAPVREPVVRESSASMFEVN